MSEPDAMYLPSVEYIDENTEIRVNGKPLDVKLDRIHFSIKNEKINVTGYKDDQVVYQLPEGAVVEEVYYENGYIGLPSPRRLIYFDYK